jgi:hypothetical protein
MSVHHGHQLHPGSHREKIAEINKTTTLRNANNKRASRSVLSSSAKCVGKNRRRAYRCDARTRGG